MMVAQYSGIALGLAVSGAVFINRALTSLESLLPMVPTDQLNALISGKSCAQLNCVYFETLSNTTQVLRALRSTLFPKSFALKPLRLLLKVCVKSSFLHTPRLLSHWSCPFSST